MTDDVELEGKIVLWNTNYGFVRPERGDDVFVHVSAVSGGPPQCGDHVTYRVEPDPKRPNRRRATNVKKVNK